MKLYGNPMSTCTRKVLMTMGEAKQPFEMITRDFAKGEHKSPEHMALQPFGQVPAIDDDGFHLYESRAIIRYLDQKFDAHLAPKDLKAHALMEQWISIETSDFAPYAMKYVYQYMFHPMRGLPTDMAEVAKGKEGLEKVLPVMEKQLSSTAYIAGNEFTLADIGFLPYLEYLVATPGKELLANYPKVSAWWAKCSERPTWKKATGKA